MAQDLDQLDAAAEAIGRALVASGLLDVGALTVFAAGPRVRDALARLEPLIVAAVDEEVDRLAAEEAADTVLYGTRD